MHGKIRKLVGATEWTLLVILGGLWGGSYFLGKVALAQVPPFTVAVCRLGLAAVVLQAALRAPGHRLPGSAPVWRGFWVMGLLNNAVPMSLILRGQIRLGSGLAAILNASSPLFTVLLLHVFTRDERMTPDRVGGVLFGLAVAPPDGPARSASFARRRQDREVTGAAVFQYVPGRICL